MAAVSISGLMESSGVKFGTSGARGRVADMTDQVCYAYTAAFLQHVSKRHGLLPGSRVRLAGDRRPSTPRIMRACAAAIVDLGFEPVNCGLIPSPAVADYGIRHGIPTLMITGSHIPDDRNGIKFNTAKGEILKDDEIAIRGETVNLPHGRFDANGALANPPALPPEETGALDEYIARYTRFFPADLLAGKRIALYEHSTVANRAFERVLTALGADVLRLGHSDVFIPVDTEAIRPEDIELAARWAREQRFHAIVSADGDGDRPLVGDEKGAWLRGDVAGVLCARYLGVEAIVTPVSSNTVAEKSGFFRAVKRTRIGSPFVIEGMDAALSEGHATVAGYEANGGFLLASAIERNGKRLEALPTRDAIIVALGILGLAGERGCAVSELSRALPPRFTASDRIKEFPTEQSARILARLQEGDEAETRARLESVFGSTFGTVEGIDTTDGLRITFRSAEIVHLRPSGNAPEFRCYNEADTPERATEMNRTCMAMLAEWRERPPL
ncbi:MAG: phosphomannomutase [Thiohalomonadaceae bacterium]